MMSRPYIFKKIVEYYAYPPPENPGSATEARAAFSNVGDNQDNDLVVLAHKVRHAQKTADNISACNV
jgi:hypothetical protein